MYIAIVFMKLVYSYSVFHEKYTAIVCFMEYVYSYGVFHETCI